jgi:hypothetical protein
MFFILEYPFSSFSSISQCIFDIFEKHSIDCPRCIYENCCQTKPCKKGYYYQVICEKWKDISFQDKDTYIVFYQQNILEKMESELIQSMNGNIDSKSILQYISQHKQDFQLFNSTWLQINDSHCHVYEYSTFALDPLSTLLSILQIMEPNFPFDKSMIEDSYKKYIQNQISPKNQIIDDFSLYQISQNEIVETNIENEIVENNLEIENENEIQTENLQNEIVENNLEIETEIEIENEIKEEIKTEIVEIINEERIVEMEENQILENEIQETQTIAEPIVEKKNSPQQIKREMEKKKRDMQKKKEEMKKKQAFKRSKIAQFQQQLYIARYTKQKNRVKVLQKIISNIKKL